MAVIFQVSVPVFPLSGATHFGVEPLPSLQASRKLFWGAGNNFWQPKTTTCHVRLNHEFFIRKIVIWRIILFPLGKTVIRLLFHSLDTTNRNHRDTGTV